MQFGSEGQEEEEDEEDNAPIQSIIATLSTLTSRPISIDIYTAIIDFHLVQHSGRT